MRIFLDANVLFTAAHNPDGKAALVIELGRAGIWRLVVSAYVVEEARRNIALKFPDCMARLDEIVSAAAIAPDVPGIACPDDLVEKNRPVYRAALGCRASVLLTGDIRDFGFLMNASDKTGGMLIQTVAQFLESPKHR